MSRPGAGLRLMCTRTYFSAKWLLLIRSNRDGTRAPSAGTLT
jgi:hypothetical protein